jgi:uncharacterized protein (TIGR04255 family)
VTKPSPQSFENICYARNFLTQVIVRADFVTPLEELTEKIPSDLAKAIVSRFPILEPLRTIKNELTVSEGSASASREEFTQWMFHGKDREKKVTISKDAFLIEVVRYSTFESMREDFRSCFDAFIQHHPLVQINRLGLRFINEISFSEGDPFDWSNLLAPPALVGFGVHSEKREIARVFSVVELSNPDSKLRIQFGMPNSDYPAPIRKKAFVLDLDAYCQDLIEHNQIPHRLDLLHTQIQEKFEFFILDNLRERMNA